MKKPAILLIASMLVLPAVPANAQLAPLYLLDRFMKAEAKKAFETPGHAAWCAKQKPGFRPKWNNWRTSNGLVEYCASPYYTPPWRATNR